MPTTRRQPRHRSKEQWCQLVDQHAMSGLTIVAFCKAQNIEPKYFSNRRLQLGYLPIKHVKKVKPMVEQPFVTVKCKRSVNHIVYLAIIFGYF